MTSGTFLTDCWDFLRTIFNVGTKLSLIGSSIVELGNDLIDESVKCGKGDRQEEWNFDTEENEVSSQKATCREIWRWLDKRSQHL